MPFLLALGTLATSCVLGLSMPAAAAQYLVRPGDDWSKLKERLKPGDEVILMPGTHRGARFDDLCGEPKNPIVIRSPDPKTVSTIVADDVGILLRRPKWVRIENIVISDARRAGIVIAGDAEGRATNISLLNVYVAKTGDFAEKAGISIDQTDHMTLKDCRIEAWYQSGVHISASTDIALSAVQFVGGANTPDEYGVAIDGGSASVILERCRFSPGIGTAIAIGLAETGVLPAPLTLKEGEKPTPRFLAEGITVERAIVKRAKRFVAFGSCANTLVRANTIIDPETAYAVLEPPIGFAHITGSSFLANLITWLPGTLKKFSTIAGGADAKGLSVEANLWNSAELPAARSILGDFVGTMKSEQILDVDPKLDGYERPQTEAARSFGHTSP